MVIVDKLNTNPQVGHSFVGFYNDEKKDEKFSAYFEDNKLIVTSDVGFVQVQQKGINRVEIFLAQRKT